MKRLIQMLSILLIPTMMLSSCGGDLIQGTTGESVDTTPGNATTETAAKTSGSEEVIDPSQYPTVATITTWADVNAIPVADASMSEAQLRKICVDFAVLQQSFQWTPSASLDYECDWAGTADKNGLLHCKTGRVFAGMPYGSGAASIYSFLDYFDETTGILKDPKLGIILGEQLGNNCGSSILWGFGRVSSTLQYHGTVRMTHANGCLKLGPYTYDLTQADFKTVGTDAICNNNGEQTMYASYAMLQAADGVVMYCGGRTGHTRMVIEKATVVHNAAGGIDGDQSYIVIVEQDSAQREVLATDGSQVFQLGSVGKKITFKSLFNGNYIPFTIAELSGQAPVQKAYVTLDKENVQTLDDLKGVTLESNYMIAKVSATVIDPDGNQETLTTRHVTGNPVYSYKMPTLVTSRMIEEIKAGSHLVISVFVSSGENLTVFECDL